jgi:hypothetical protein
VQRGAPQQPHPRAQDAVQPPPTSQRRTLPEPDRARKCCEGKEGRVRRAEPELGRQAQPDRRPAWRGRPLHGTNRRRTASGCRRR